MFKLKDKITGEAIQIYAVRSHESKTEFLIYDKQIGFAWNDSTYFKPNGDIEND